MPWSNQSGGGRRGGGGGGPWGQGPSGGPHQQPDLEELLKRSQDRLKQVMPGGGGPPGLLMFLLMLGGALVVGYFAFFFMVRVDEVGVVLRFGKFDREVPSGLHFRLPYPIEEVRLPKVTAQNIIEIGFESARGGARRPRRAGREPDAHRRREHRGGRLRRALAHQGRAEVPLQHPEARRDREGGGRERHARGGRAVGDQADHHRGPLPDGRGRAEADAGGARLLRLRHRHRAGDRC